MSVEISDYVLATKYSDGDPMDHFCVGFVSGFLGDDTQRRILVVDNEGQLFRANGFRRAEKLTREEGDALVEMFATIGDKRGPSLWWHLAKIRGEENPVDACAATTPPATDYNAIFPSPKERQMSKLVSGIGIGLSLLTAAIFGVILNESASKMSYANEVWQWVSVGVIVASIIAFGVCAFFFARQK